MFLPGVSLKIKLLGIAVLAILTFSLIGTTLELINQAIAEGAGEPQYSRSQFANYEPTQNLSSSEEHAVIGGLKFVCPFH